MYITYNYSSSECLSQKNEDLQASNQKKPTNSNIIITIFNSLNV